MKKLTTLLLSTIISTSLFSQIEVSKNSKPTLVGKVQHFECKKYTDSTYTFLYRDYKYTHITEHKIFTLSENDFNDLYIVIENGFIDGEKESITVETSNDILILKFIKVFGVVNLQIYHLVNKNKNTIGVSKYLTKKATDKLFGK